MQNNSIFTTQNNFLKTSAIPSRVIFSSKIDFSPKITFAIPTYRRPIFLMEAINSVICQQGSILYDIIVVDNDPVRHCETENLLKNYENSILTYYKNSTNLNLVGNWNRCFELAKGDYVILLHDDDFLEPNFLIECIDYLNSEDVGILKPRFINNKSKKNNNRKIYQLFEFDNFLRFALGAPTGCIFRKKYVIEIGGFNDEYFPSFDYFFSILFSKHYKIFLLNKQLINYRIEVNTSSKIEILNGIIHKNFLMQSNLMKQYHIHNYFIRSALSVRYKKLITSFKRDYNKDFKFNLEIINLKNKTTSLDRLIYLGVRNYQRLLRHSMIILLKFKVERR